MRRLLSAIAVVVFSSCAFAQPPFELAPTDMEINVSVGRTDVLKFADAFDEIRVVSTGIVQAQAVTDHTLSLTGQAPGSTVFYVFAGQKQLLSARVNVADDAPGHQIKVYSRDTPDYHGFYCNKLGCGRADKDAPNRLALPNSGSVSTTIYPSGASTVTSTKNY